MQVAFELIVSLCKLYYLCIYSRNQYFLYAPTSQLVRMESIIINPVNICIDFGDHAQDLRAGIYANGFVCEGIFSLFFYFVFQSS